jgi:hypothetical protein
MGKKERDEAIDRAVEQNGTLAEMMQDLQNQGIVQQGALGELFIPQDDDEE